MFNLNKFLLLSSRALAVRAVFAIGLLPVWAFAQIKSAPVVPKEDYTWWYLTLGVLFLVLGIAVFRVVKSRNAQKQVEESEKKKQASRLEADDSLDATKEMEWFRQHRKVVSKDSTKKSLAKNLPKTKEVLDRTKKKEESRFEFSEQQIKEKLQQLQFTSLPIAKISQLELARPYSLLPISNDDALMSAIEQTQDEFEEDETVRELAVRILARFKTRNSVESLSQVALYDLSSNLRSKAVSILADFDHESVFETILLACADPTREVRAAAARGLFRLSFDRADAWTRIAETRDEFRMRQAARSAMEADLVMRSLDRLVHQDQKIAYEALTLLSLIIRTDEAEKVFSVVENHRDENVKLAFVKVLEIVRDERVLPRLEAMLDRTDLSKELRDRVTDLIDTFEYATV